MIDGTRSCAASVPRDAVCCSPFNPNVQNARLSPARPLSWLVNGIPLSMSYEASRGESYKTLRPVQIAAGCTKERAFPRMHRQLVVPWFPPTSAACIRHHITVITCKAHRARLDSIGCLCRGCPAICSIDRGRRNDIKDVHTRPAIEKHGSKSSARRKICCKDRA